MFVCKRAFVTAWVFFTGYSMTDGCLLTDDVTFKAVISVPPPLPAFLPCGCLHPSSWSSSLQKLDTLKITSCTSRLLQIGVRGVPLTRVERKRFLSQSAGLAVLDLLVLLAVTDVLVVSLPVILPVSERQGLAPCFISLSRRISWKNLPDFETWAGTRHTWSLLPICCTCGRNKMLSVFCLFIDNCINFWEVCFLIWHSFGGFLFCFWVFFDRFYSFVSSEICQYLLETSQH